MCIVDFKIVLNRGANAGELSGENVVNVSWQYKKRLQYLSEDVERLNFDISVLSPLDFVVSPVAKNDLATMGIRKFIVRYEWLGTISPYPTHYFSAMYNNLLGGVVIMDMPSPFSKMLGEDTKYIERLIARGACASWTPKNLNSHLIMASIRWMSINTQYRLFTAYADPEAWELGTIYQACNFFYLGQKFGTRKTLVLSSGKEVSDRYFRTRSAYKRYAKMAGIAWIKSWQERDRILFSHMPPLIEETLRKIAKEEEAKCIVKYKVLKHKYAYIRGRNKIETRHMRNEFLDRNKTYPYPSVRGR